VLRPLFLLLFALASPATAFAELLNGSAAAIDGRTIAVGGVPVRLLDLDAPEPAQHCRDAAGADYGCGERALAELAALVEKTLVVCDWANADAAGRKLARCTIEGRDLALPLLERGWALPDRDCKCETYRDAAVRARTARRGLWAGSFDLPWDWRARHPAASAP
jgi:endonuclease YncB( thermonuclease family)